VTTPIAFMVMPFGTKKIDSAKRGVPPEVDFNALWANVHQPVLKELGYRAVRADADLGALIINEMVQRLAIADLIVADISLPNANVYYEIGVRHAARRDGCVLVAAAWATPVFDLAQMRRLPYPLADGTCGVETTGQAREALRAGLEDLIPGQSPVFAAVPGYPRTDDPTNGSAFEELVDALSGFQADVAMIRNAVNADTRRKRTLTLLADYGSQPAVRDTVAVEIIGLARDHVGADETLNYINGLPRHLQNHPPVIEQKQIALARSGDVLKAATQLELLIAKAGPSSDRYGILGGRYKQLMKQSDPATATYRNYLGKTIDAYERGMAEDLNDYYPSSNLPRLYRRRGDPGDEQRALNVATTVMAACTRVLERDGDDGWVRLTLLGAAFDRGDGTEARRLAREIERSRPAMFHLETTMADLQASYDLQTTQGQAELGDTLEFVRSMLSRAGTDVE
jgi:hypothetical protein